MVSSLVMAGAAASASACSSADPPLPTDTNPVQVALNAPPPISGGTLLVSTTHQNLAVAADSDRDVVWLVDTSARTFRSVALQAGDEPGRVVEDKAGHVHVALRGAGAVATIDLDAAKVIDRTPVCSAPRGLAFDGASSVHVACAGGELVTLPAAGGAPTRSLRLDRDLRDVVVQGPNLLITRFRSAELLTVDATGTIINRQTPPAPDNTTPAPKLLGATFVPDAAWRAIPSPTGGVMLAHQLAATSTVVISQPGGYGDQGGGPCDGSIVKTSLTAFNADGNPMHVGLPAPALTGASLPVDVAFDGIGSYGIVSAASNSVFLALQEAVDPGMGGGGCQGSAQVQMPGATPGQTGQPVAIAALSPGKFVVQIREPAQIVILESNGGAIDPNQTISLHAPSRLDTGHYLFHHNASASSFLACASCHMEGHDDGHAWVFDTLGARRTQTVAGGVLETAPLHWNGDMSGLPDIMNEVFVHRMGGSPQGVRHIEAFGDWLNAIPRYPASPSGTQAQIAHGEQIFNSAEAACTTCHSGKHFTNNQNHNVGTGAPGQTFQVPGLLGVAARAPYMHDGCAKTLQDRFDPAQAACNGGENHGHTAQLSAADIADLIAYLETL